MIVVKEKKSVPHADIRCGNCGSLLQYGNADLTHDYERERDDAAFLRMHMCIIALIVLSADVK